MCRNLSFRYRDYLFHGYSGTLPQSRIGIMGRNGSGKTTMLRLLAGRLAPESGEVSLGGSSYLVDFDLTRFKNFTADDMVALCRRLPESFDTGRVDEILAGLGMSQYRSLPLGELSKGAAKKVSLMMGLCSRADVLLLDEPFEGLDTDACTYLVAELDRGARSAVVVSHQPEWLEQCVDVIVRVEDQALVPVVEAAA